jgi:1,2-diacylglycerol 3-beta-galactosyltransferase
MQQRIPRQLSAQHNNRRDGMLSVSRQNTMTIRFTIRLLLLFTAIASENTILAFTSTRTPSMTRHALRTLRRSTTVHTTSSDATRQVDEPHTSSITTTGTIQILMSDTGGGHRASANALQDAFNTLYPGQIHCDIVDIYTDYGPVWPYNDYVAIYKYMAANPWMWALLYEFGKSEFGLWFNQFMLDLFCTEAFTKCICRPQSTNHNLRADMIVSVHPLTQDLPLNILSKLDGASNIHNKGHRTTPFCTVVTDLGSAHPTWFNPRYVLTNERAALDIVGMFYVAYMLHVISNLNKTRSYICVFTHAFTYISVDKCFVPSDALYNAARQRQLQPHQLVQYGLPIRKGFWSQEIGENVVDSDDSNNNNMLSLQQSLRQKLGLNVSIPVILVVGGGDGMGGIIDISKQLGYELSCRLTNMQSQMIVICGKNEFAKEELERTSWGGNVMVHIKGFVNNMDEYMRASDVLVTKAGPGTIAEASICGLPCMMFSYLYVCLR